MPAQNDQYQKHPTPFVAYLFNQTGESGDVYTIWFKLALSLVDKHYVNDSGFHH